MKNSTNKKKTKKLIYHKWVTEETHDTKTTLLLTVSPVAYAQQATLFLYFNSYVNPGKNKVGLQFQIKHSSPNPH